MSLRNTSVAVLLLLATLTACAGTGSTHLPSTSSPTSQGHKKPQDILGGVGGLLSVLLTDAPPQIGNLTPTEIDLGVTGVAVVANGTVNPIASYSQPVIVNVLAAQAQPSSIGIGSYFSGQYQGVQFTFDVASSHIVANNTTYPIAFLAGNNALSSAGAGATTTTSGDAKTVTVTVDGNFVINGSPAASIQADFNALESLAQAADGSIVARPTLFAVPYTEAATIAGTVTNASGAPVSGAVVVALDASGHVANTTSTDASGAYSLHTLWAGSYTVVVYNTYKTASGQTLTASGNSNTAASVTGPTIDAPDQTTTTAPAIQD